MMSLLLAKTLKEHAIRMPSKQVVVQHEILLAFKSLLTMLIRFHVLGIGLGIEILNDILVPWKSFNIVTHVAILDREYRE